MLESKKVWKEKQPMIAEAGSMENRLVPVQALYKQSRKRILVQVMMYMQTYAWRDEESLNYNDS